MEARAKVVVGAITLLLFFAMCLVGEIFHARHDIETAQLKTELRLTEEQLQECRRQLEKR